MNNNNPLDGLQHLFQNVLGLWNHPAAQPQAAAPKQTLESMGWSKGTDGVYRQKGDQASAPAATLPAAAPVATPTPQPQQGGFKFQMGQSDYANLKPQIDAVLKGTPLAPYENDFIQAADRHKIDPRVLLTIANNESSMGKNYPQDSYNPFGYNAGGAGNVTGPDGKQYVNVDQGLKNAGFTSLPMAIDALTGRFERQPTEGYKTFYNDPTVENLQAAYNANPAEKANYIKNAQALISQFQH